MAAAIVEEQVEPAIDAPVEAQIGAQVTALALQPSQRAFTADQRAMLAARNIAVDKINPAMMGAFLHLCLMRGVDPFIGEATVIPTEDGGWAAIMQMDGFRVIAERTGEYEGVTEPQWCGEDGVWRDVWPGAWGRPYAARVGVYRRGHRQAAYGVAHIEEYEVHEWIAPEGGGPKRRVLTRRWQDGGQVKTMLAKCAKAAGFRDAFPRELDGFYTPEEMDRVRKERREAEEARLAAEGRARRAAAYAEATGQPEREETLPGVHEGDVVEHQGEPVRAAEPVMETVVRLRHRAQAHPDAEVAEDAPPVEEAAEPVDARADTADLPLTEAERVACLLAEITEQAMILGVPVERLTARVAATTGTPFEEWDSATLLRAVAPMRKPVAAKLEKDPRRFLEAAPYAGWGPQHVDTLDVLFGRS